MYSSSVNEEQNLLIHRHGPEFCYQHPGFRSIPALKVSLPSRFPFHPSRRFVASRLLGLYPPESPIDRRWNTPWVLQVCDLRPGFVLFEQTFNVLHVSCGHWHSDQTDAPARLTNVLFADMVLRPRDADQHVDMPNSTVDVNNVNILLMLISLILALTRDIRHVTCHFSPLLNEISSQGWIHLTPLGEMRGTSTVDLTKINS